LIEPTALDALAYVGLKIAEYGAYTIIAVAILGLMALQRDGSDETGRAARHRARRRRSSQAEGRRTHQASQAAEAL
jgi:hypothetical protein